MFKKSFLKFGAFVGVLPVLLFPFVASASLADQNATGGLNAIGTAINPNVNQANSLPVLIGRIINGVLGVLGIILVVLIIQAGIMYMTAAGDPAKVDKAKKMITQAVVGMIIIVLAYSISSFVISTLSTATA